jgi:multidrug efflux pump subunit AcrA (membrane-fusion protein)
VIVAAAGTAYALKGTKSAAYRIAAVTTSSVTQTLQQSGTVEPISQATVSFPVAGTVATVAVKAGQAVTAGQTLGTLDTSALQASLTAQQAALAAAQLTLQQALTAASTPIAATPTSPAPLTSAGSSQTTTSASASGATKALAQDAAAVTNAQKAVDNAMA